VDFCLVKNIVINFPEQWFTMERDCTVSRNNFAYENDIPSTRMGSLGPADYSTQTDVESMQKAANSMTTADYHRYNLRSEEASMLMRFLVVNLRTII
jgi:hypothetical protein